MNFLLAGVDWHHFLPAVQAFIHGQNPYLVGEEFGGVYEPFWTYIFLAPFAILPFQTGRVLVFAVSFLAFAFTAIKMGANRLQLVLFLTSRAVLGGLYEGNIDWLVTLGLWMPPQMGLFFVMMKPQMGICIAIYWLSMAWQQGGWREITRTFAPITLAYLLSFLMYGFWPSQLLGMPHNPANGSTFPWAVPMGLVILYIALKRQDLRLSGFSSPLISPYVTDYNYSISLLSLFNRPALFIAAWVAFWIAPIVSMFT